MAKNNSAISYTRMKSPICISGYLIEEKCSDAAAKFLETSSHLKECLSALQKGKSFQTKFDGRNLVTLLDILSQAKNQGI